MVDDERREPLRRLVEEQQFGAPHERAGDGEHLLLPAGQVPASTVGQLPERGKDVVHSVDRPARGLAAAARRHVEVLRHGEVGEDPPVLGHEADAGPRHAVRRPARDVAALPDNATRGRRRQPHDAADGRRLADTVPAEQAHALARVDGQGHAEEDAGEPVGGVDVPHFEDHGTRSPR